MIINQEPVITSSERQIGCRVKDYYFGVDHIGIDQDFVRENIAIGDIIVLINDANVLSSKFLDILDKLRLAKESVRRVVFKDISISG